MSPKARTTSTAKAKTANARNTAPKIAPPKTGKTGTAKGSATKRRPPTKKIAAPTKPPRATRPTGIVPRTLDEFMREALVMEVEAAQRYTDFADAMETHNNLEVAALFRKMAVIEGKHAAQIMAEMGWTAMPPPRASAASWQGFEAPETAPGDEVHYLMQPYHALELALANEERAERFFARLARAATTAAVRKAARELQEEERQHVLLVRAWMKKVPPPDADWANDPDPPVYTD